MVHPDTSRGPRRLVVGAGFVAVAISFMNVTTYAFTALVARSVAPSVFGEVTALMGILLVGSVAALGLQATTARRLATCPADQRAHLTRDAARATVVIGSSATLLVLVLSPLLLQVLALEHWAPLAVVAVTLLPLAVFGTQAGVAQGTNRWRHLALLYVGVGAGRMVFGTLGALIAPTATGALVGVLIGALVPVAIGWRLLLAPPGPDHGPATARDMVVETLVGSQALLAFFAVTNADAVLARVVLSADDSGLYAAGLIVAKAALFLPQFVAIVVFPTLARADRPGVRRAALFSVAALGAVAALGTWLLPDLALVFAGGDRYAQVTDLLPLFAVEGAVFAVVNLLVYDSLAERSARMVVALWSVLAGVVLTVVLFVDTLAGLVLTMIVAGLCSCVAHIVLRGNPARQ
ncbi:MAG: lipopolysaccharide biosynthesis protein [Nocardioidaceae bacterium]